MEIKLEDIVKLAENDGLTLKAGKVITYKTGWQVADYGVECNDAESCYEAVKQFNGNCGIWLEKGIYYVDHSFRVKTKRDALAIGKAHNQISIYGWATGALAYC